VRRGDTLLQIARRYGARLDEVIELNHIRDPDRLVIGQQLHLPRAPGQHPAPSSARLERYQRELDRAEQQLARADFQGAASRLERLRRQVDPSGPGSTRILIRLEELAASVYVAFGDEESATASFGRALDLDPSYTPSAHLSPKVMRAFERAQQESRAR
jgi:LysM repeat protein